MSNLDEYVQKLASPNELDRTYAAEDLGYLNSPEAVTPLLERLRVETSQTVRITIFQALIRTDGDESIIGAIRLLTSDDSQVRNLAVGLLHRKGERAIPFLKEAMRDGDRDTRKFVLDVLSGIKSSGTSEIYVMALADEDPNVVITAVENLGNTRGEEFCSHIEELLLREKAHPMLTAACLEALASIGNPLSMAVVRQRFPAPSGLPPFFFTPYLKAMGALGGEKEFNELLHLLPAHAPQLYPLILGTLITLHERIYQHSTPPEPSAELLTALHTLVASDQPAACRYQAVRVLGFWAQRDDVAASLVTCLSNLERFVRLGAAEALRSSQRSGFEALLAAYEKRESEEEVSQAKGR